MDKKHFSFEFHVGSEEKPYTANAGSNIASPYKLTHERIITAGY